MVLSNKSVPGGVEIMAGHGPRGLGQIEQAARITPATPTPAARAPFSERAAPERRPASASRQTVGRDVEQLAMSTLSFQDYVRERMLRRRDAELRGQVEPTLDAAPARLPTPNPWPRSTRCAGPPRSPGRCHGRAVGRNRRRRRLGAHCSRPAGAAPPFAGAARRGTGPIRRAQRFHGSVPTLRTRRRRCHRRRDQ